MFLRILCQLAGIATFACLAMASPSRAEAQPQPRTLEVPANAAWQHAETGLILSSRVAGAVRSQIRDSTASEMDVSAAYSNDAEGLTVTVYLYRTMTPDVALWFDRAVNLIMLRPGFGLENAPWPPATAFAHPGGTTNSGLRASLDVNTAETRSTAVAIAPVGTSWLLKIRMSSSRLDRAALDERLTAFIQGLRWPAETSPARVAVPILACASPLRLRNARVVRSDMSNALIDAVSGSIVAEHEAPPPVYCREPGATIAQGVYRPNGSSEAYLIALGDSGTALSLGEALDLSAIMGGGGGGRRIAMTLLGRNDTSVYPSFNRLPPPEQALAVAGRSGTTISVTTSDRPRP